MEKLTIGRPKILNTDKFIICCGKCKTKIRGIYLSKRANCGNNCKLENPNYIRQGAIYYNKYTKEEYKKSEISLKDISKINIERYKMNIIKQKIMVKRIQNWIRHIIYKPGGELYNKIKKNFEENLKYL